MKKIISPILLVICLVSFYNCSEKQVKVDACMKISKARIAQDSSFVHSFIDLLAEGSDKDEATNKILSLILLSCYQRINFYRADEVNRMYKDYKQIKSTSDEFKELLNLERWFEVFTSNDQEVLQNEMATIQDALRDIKSEDLNFEGMTEAGSRREEEYDAQDIHYDVDKKVDLNLFGINLTQLDWMTKNIIGFALIFFIFFSVIYALNWIKKLRQKDVKKVKKAKAKAN